MTYNVFGGTLNPTLHYLIVTTINESLNLSYFDKVMLEKKGAVFFTYSVYYYYYYYYYLLLSA